MKDTLGGRANFGKRVALRHGENNIRERIWTHGSTAAAKNQKVNQKIGITIMIFVFVIKAILVFSYVNINRQRC